MTAHLVPLGFLIFVNGLRAQTNQIRLAALLMLISRETTLQLNVRCREQHWPSFVSVVNTLFLMRTVLSFPGPFSVLLLEYCYNFLMVLY